MSTPVATMTFTAVFTNGVFVPEVPIDLPENTRVILTIVAIHGIAAKRPNNLESTSEMTESAG